ncbi:MAG: SUMF1/EgtB/PvdO family nonheme iron enzyme, partial [Planctomycetes bacterium]|nr:SUMF1/EgtB/PvdO family nonheme iron enzyme [Planctomycetota bacterium]
MRSGRYWSPVPFVLTFLLFAASIGGYWLWSRYGESGAGGVRREEGGDPVIVAPLTGRPAQDPGSGPPAAQGRHGDLPEAPGDTPPGPVALDRSKWTAGGGAPVLLGPGRVESAPPALPTIPAVPPRASTGSSGPGPAEAGSGAGAEELLEGAREALGAGDFERALAMAEEASRQGGGPEAAELADIARHRAALLSRAREAEAENRRQFETLFDRAESLAGEGKWREAVQTYQAAGDRLGSSDVADRARLKAALDRARKAYLDGLDETDFEGWRAKALQACEAGRWREADEAFSRARAFGRLGEADQEKADLARRRMLREGMVLVPAGEFVMGSDDPAARDVPTTPEVTLRKVYVDAFLIDRCEVTNAEYKRFVAETSHPPPPGWSGNEFPADEGNHPVTGVSWYDARQYAEWAGTRL